MVNEPSVFESLKFYCISILLSVRIGSERALFVLFYIFAIFLSSFPNWTQLLKTALALQAR